MKYSLLLAFVIISIANTALAADWFLTNDSYSKDCTKISSDDFNRLQQKHKLKDLGDSSYVFYDGEEWHGVSSTDHVCRVMANTIFSKRMAREMDERKGAYK